MQGERKLLARMLETALDLPPRITDAADLRLFEHPLVEWVMRRFLLALDHVVQRGLRSDYLRVEEEQPFLRGQLDVVRHMRAPPGRAHHFQIRHDVFVVDRPENRLLKSALLRVRDAAREPDNWRLANELAHRLEEVPHSTDVSGDFRRWRSDRLMAHYQPVRPWCELVLGQHMPMALLGDTQGLSLLFPMEKLFERYVAAHLRRRLPAGLRLTEQLTRRSLCEHDGKPFFQLRPDLLIEGQGRTLVLDTKWKRIDSTKRDKCYDLSQSDFYQLYAYGHTYMNGTGDMAMIYPSTAAFDDHLLPFRFNAAMRLWVLPFDLERCELVAPADFRLMIFGPMVQAA
jgi:5-methylcytosine-specific restriction enzyme subunit McrC